MPTPALPPLVIGSCQPFSGKSAVVLGLARQLSRLGVSISFGKPLATCLDDPDAAHPAADAVPLEGLGFTGDAPAVYQITQIAQITPPRVAADSPEV